MFDRLQSKWGVSGFRFVLIFCIFAIGGSLTGYLARKLMPVFGIEQLALYWFVYVIVVTILWPFCVLAVSLPLGQFVFFRNYIGKMGRRLSSRRKK